MIKILSITQVKCTRECEQKVILEHAHACIFHVHAIPFSRDPAVVQYWLSYFSRPDTRALQRTNAAGTTTGTGRFVAPKHVRKIGSSNKRAMAPLRRLRIKCSALFEICNTLSHSSQ